MLWDTTPWDISSWSAKPFSNYEYSEWHLLIEKWDALSLVEQSMEILNNPEIADAIANMRAVVKHAQEHQQFMNTPAGKSYNRSGPSEE